MFRQRLVTRWTGRLGLGLMGVLFLALVGCSAKAPQADAVQSRSGSSERATAASAPAAARPAPPPAQGGPPPPAAPPPAAPSRAPTLLASFPAPDPSLQRKLVMNADISVKVPDARKAIQEIHDLAQFNRGYVADSNLNGSDSDGWTGKVMLRIPTANYGDAVANLRKLGEVRQERQWTQDVTEQYVDAEARLKILQEHEQRLRELALKADKFEDWLRLTQQTNDTRIQIESLTGRLRYLNNQVEFSTLNVSITQPGTGKDKTDGKPGVLSRMSEAFGDSLDAMVDVTAGLMIFLAGFLPIALVLAIVLAIVMRVRRNWRRPSAPPAEQPPQP